MKEVRTIESYLYTSVCPACKGGPSSRTAWLDTLFLRWAKGDIYASKILKTIADRACRV